MRTPRQWLRHRLQQWVMVGRPTLLRLRAGDIIVVTVYGQRTAARESNLRVDLEEVLGYRHDILFLDGDTTLAVARPGAAG